MEQIRNKLAHYKQSFSNYLGDNRFVKRLRSMLFAKQPNHNQLDDRDVVLRSRTQWDEAIAWHTYFFFEVFSHIESFRFWQNMEEIYEKFYQRAKDNWYRFLKDVVNDPDFLKKYVTEKLKVAAENIEKFEAKNLNDFLQGVQRGIVKKKLTKHKDSVKLLIRDFPKFITLKQVQESEILKQYFISKKLSILKNYFEFAYFYLCNFIKNYIISQTKSTVQLDKDLESHIALDFSKKYDEKLFFEDNQMPFRLCLYCFICNEAYPERGLKQNAKKEDDIDQSTIPDKESLDMDSVSIKTARAERRDELKEQGVFSKLVNDAKNLFPLSVRNKEEENNRTDDNFDLSDTKSTAPSDTNDFSDDSLTSLSNKDLVFNRFFSPSFPILSQEKSINEIMYTLMGLFNDMLSIIEILFQIQENKGLFIVNADKQETFLQEKIFSRISSYSSFKKYWLRFYLLRIFSLMQSSKKINSLIKHYFQNSTVSITKEYSCIMRILSFLARNFTEYKIVDLNILKNTSGYDQMIERISVEMAIPIGQTKKVISLLLENIIKRIKVAQSEKGQELAKDLLNCKIESHSLQEQDLLVGAFKNFAELYSFYEFIL